LLPTAFERAIPWAAAEYGGVDLSVGNVDLSVLTGEIIAHDLELEMAAGLDAPLLALDRIHLNLRWLALARSEAWLEDLVLEGVRVMLRQGANGEVVLPW
jgi:uncharacterized protein involved in outer membrane biogenesis